MRKIISFLAIIFVIGTVTVSADSSIPSPTGTVVYNVTFYNGDYNALPYSIEDGDTFVGRIDMTKGSWDKWTFFKTDGTDARLGTDYEMINCTNLSSTVTIKPHTDLIICANYDEEIVPVKPKKKSLSLLKGSNTDNSSDDSSERTLNYNDMRKVSFALAGFCIGVVMAFLFLSTAFGGSEE